MLGTIKPITDKNWGHSSNFQVINAVIKYIQLLLKWFNENFRTILLENYQCEQNVKCSTTGIYLQDWRRYTNLDWKYFGALINLSRSVHK